MIRQQAQQLKKSIRGLKHEGFRQTYILKSVEEVEAVLEIKREKLYNDKKLKQVLSTLLEMYTDVLTS